MSARKEYIENSYFGKIKFLREIEPTRSKLGNLQRVGEFECFCGKVFTKLINSIVSLNTKSCGCKENRNNNPELKGCSHTPEYAAWTNLKARCTNPRANNYHRYGGRGIKVCNRWLHSFENFLKDMGERPSPDYSLDRIDNNGNYCPENCRWATKEEQVRNRNSNVYFNISGKKTIMKDILKEKCMTYLSLKRKLEKGYTIEDIVNNEYIKYKRCYEPVL